MRVPGWALGSCAGALLGAGLALGIGGSRSESPQLVSASAEPGAVDELQRRVSQLQLQLDREVEKRAALEGRLAEATRRPPAVASAPAPPAADVRRPAARRPGQPEAGRIGDHWIDAEVLASGSFSASEIERLQERFEAIELEKLYLRDRATREGWIGRPRYARELHELDQGYAALRDDYGDEAYDWILFASGRRNRIVVQRVMEDSEAASVGLEPGDLIWRYDERRVFDMRALQRATSEGALGRTTAIDVLRDGESLRLYAGRGPLGVALLMRSVEPSEPLY